jgi:hypothetical protein
LNRRHDSGRTVRWARRSEGATAGARQLRLQGEIDNDSDGNLWWCVAGGARGSWRKLAGPDNGIIVPINPSTRQITVIAGGGASSQTDFVVDADGYFA